MSHADVETLLDTERQGLLRDVDGIAAAVVSARRLACNASAHADQRLPDGWHCRHTVVRSEKLREKPRGCGLMPEPFRGSRSLSL